MQFSTFTKFVKEWPDQKVGGEKFASLLLGINER
jgi:hypothetical protein